MFNKDDKVKVIAEDNYFVGYTGTVVKEEESDFETDNGKEITEVTVKLDVDLEDENKDVLETFYSDELKLVAKNESLNEENNNLNESLLKEAKENIEDLIHRYVYLEDLDGKEIPAWNFASRIATAENLEEGHIEELAKELGYKLILVEAPNIWKVIIAAKEVKLDDIKEEYADFLLGNAVIRELK